MKHKKLIFGLLFLQSSFLAVNADPPSGPTGSVGVGSIPIWPKEGPTKGRPKAPSAQRVEARYEDGYLYLNFKYSEGPAVLYVYDSAQTSLRSQTVFNTDSEAALYIGNLYDAYILIVTSNGHEYEGWI